MKILPFLVFIVFDYVCSQSNSNQEASNLSIEKLESIFSNNPIHTNSESSSNLNSPFIETVFNQNTLSQNSNPIPYMENCECAKFVVCDGLQVGLQDTCRNHLLECCKKEHNNIIKQKPAIDSRIETIKPINLGCGKRNLEGGGYRMQLKANESKFAEFPWMVAILRQEAINTKNLVRYKCGGSLIHPKVVLTAAHCVDEPEMKFTIRAGEWDTKFTYENLNHQDRGVKDIIIHPNFKNISLHNDIALIILDSPFELMPHVDTVCLPSQDEALENVRCIATGWGKDSFQQNSKYHDILKMVELPIVPPDACQAQLRTSRLGQYFILDRSFICAGGELGVDTCTGDGGSPLVCRIPGKKNKYQQRGIVAWGIGCGDELPAVYGNLADFRYWIDNQMLKLKLNTSSYTD